MSLVIKSLNYVLGKCQIRKKKVNLSNSEVIRVDEAQ